MKLSVIKYLFFVAISCMVLQSNAKEPFRLQDSQQGKRIDLGVTVLKDTILLLPNELENIGGLSVDMVVSRNRGEYIARIILEDNMGKRFLVAESYKELDSKDGLLYFSDYCEETGLLNGIKPVKLYIYVKGATISLSALHITTANVKAGNGADRSAEISALRRMQVQEKVNRINEYNRANNKLWKAGITSMSLRDFSDKMRLLGFNESISTGGMEYYIGGIFEIGNNTMPLRSQNLTYIDHFDWRNRHGKSWITPNKNQGESNFCYFFTSVACTEAMVNLYYNRMINYDLSEQELACCGGITYPNEGVPNSHIFMKWPLEYIKEHGICDEEAYPFIDNPDSVICRSSEIVPNELVRIGDYGRVDITNEDSIKDALIKHGPLISGIRRWVYDPDSTAHKKGHAMLIVGYGQLHVGDTIYHWIDETGHENGAFTVLEDDPRVGKTYWIYKNSYGLSLDEAHQGYMHVIHDNYETSMNVTYYLLPPISTIEYTDSDRVCEDADGDGLYSWGLGDRPSFCPIWIPCDKDGDDSNPSKGKMLTSPVYGELENLGPFSGQVYSNNTSFTSRTTFYNDIVILNNVTLTINDIFNLLGQCRIYIQDGGHLIIDGGVLTNAKFILQSGSKITLKNGGKVVMRTNTDFEAPVGAVIDITHGEIIGSNNF